MNHKRTQEISGTYLQGYTVSTTRRQISAVFGDPTEYQEGGKVSIEWGILFNDGTLATVYDWKRYEQGTPGLDEEMIYNIGGLTPEAVARVADALKGADKAKIKRSVFIEARLWLDKSGGNTYFTARVWVDGHIVSTLPFQYGYGNQYLYEANEELIRLGYIGQEYSGRPLWVSTREALGVDMYYAEAYVTKKNLFKEESN
jgi:hypothetical protein